MHVNISWVPCDRVEVDAFKGKCYTISYFKYTLITIITKMCFIFKRIAIHRDSRIHWYIYLKVPSYEVEMLKSNSILFGCIHRHLLRVYSAFPLLLK